MGDFKKFLKEIREETTSADIATVDTKLDLVKRPKHLEKGKSVLNIKDWIVKNVNLKNGNNKQRNNMAEKIGKN